MVANHPEDAQPLAAEIGCPDRAIYLTAMHGVLSDWHPTAGPAILAAQLGLALAIYSEHFDQHLS